MDYAPEGTPPEMIDRLQNVFPTLRKDFRLAR